MQDIHGILSKAAQTMDLPSDAISPDSCITLTGRHECKLEGHTGIRVYEHNEIVVGLKRGEVSVRGRDLQVRLMHRDRLILTGEITELSFLGGQG